VVQAVCAALLLTNAAVLLAEAFPGAGLGRAMGVYLAGFSTGHVVGPLLAGVVTMLLDWRWLFLLNAPLGAAAVVWGVRVLPRRPAERAENGDRLDMLGSLSLGVGLAGLLLALSRVPQRGWADSLVVGGIGGAILATAHLWVHLRRSMSPVLDLELFRDRAFTVAFVTSCIVIWPRLVTGAMVALYVQSVDGGSTLRAAAVVAPLAVAVTAASLATGHAVRRRSDEAVALGAILVAAAGVCCLLGSIGSSIALALQAVGVTLVGLGTGMFGAVNSSMIVRLAPADKVGRTNALRTLGTNGSYAIGLAAGLSVITSGLAPSSAAAFFAARTAALTPNEMAGVLQGYRAFWIVVLILLLTAAVGTWTLLNARSEARHEAVATLLDSP
jgi:MFS family permease